MVELCAQREREERNPFSSWRVRECAPTPWRALYTLDFNWYQSRGLAMELAEDIVCIEGSWQSSKPVREPVPKNGLVRVAWWSKLGKLYIYAKPTFQGSLL